MPIKDLAYAYIHGSYYDEHREMVDTWTIKEKLRMYKYGTAGRAYFRAYMPGNKREERLHYLIESVPIDINMVMKRWMYGRSSYYMKTIYSDTYAIPLNFFFTDKSKIFKYKEEEIIDPRELLIPVTVLDPSSVTPMILQRRVNAIDDHCIETINGKHYIDGLPWNRPEEGVVLRKNKNHATLQAIEEFQKNYFLII